MKGILIAVAVIITCKVFAQEPATQDYVIITYEYKHKPNFEGTYTYYWIILQDSIKQHKSVLFPLFLKSYSKNDQIDCCNGKDIDPYATFSGTIIQQFDSGDDHNQEILQAILKKHRKKLLTLTKKWKFGWKETVSVFATPVSGKFCSSNLHPVGQYQYGYKGKVYVPYSSFAYLGTFWKSEKGKSLLHQDLLNDRYNRFPHE